MLVAAYNEESVIEQKLRNTAALDYPTDKLELLLGLDAPTDATRERARGNHRPGFRVFPFTERRGKLAVLLDLAGRTQADLLVFSDANTLLEPDSIRMLVHHFANPNVGAVCGELRLVSADGKMEMESLYWRYEVALKFLENRLNCVLGANGAVFAVRRELYRPPASAIVEDFQVPMDIRFAGYRVVYEPEALGTEENAPTHVDEFRRKVRIGAGAYQALLTNPGFLNPFRGMPAFAYFSHKVLRWLVPFMLPAMFVANLLLARFPLYLGLLAAQSAFYLLALAGWLRSRESRSGGIAGAAFYFVSMNWALLLGFFRFVGGSQKAVWSSTPRGTPRSDGSPVTRPAIEDTTEADVPADLAHRE
jgi:cellulose synthase/poly-beta-1,6-N-acetylglucosamine synthase-like glycosyltransferase